MRICTVLICLLYAGTSFANDGHSDTLYASRLHPYGRYRFTAGGELEMISSAMHVGFTFEGTQCAIYASDGDPNGHNYIQYELDGVYQKRLRVNGGATDPIVITTAGAGKHTVWVYKTTEANTGPVLLSKVAGNHIKAISVAKAPLIEFIGNSITCGADADTADYPCGVGAYHDYHNGYMAYGPRVARALGVNYILSSVSGIGIYRTWNKDTPSMPQVYENTDLQTKETGKWDFSKYTPSIVSIALGTNDLSNGDGKTPRKPFNEAEFITRYVEFVKLVKTKYPKAQIALLSSPMVKGRARVVLERSLGIIAGMIEQTYPGDKRIHTFFFPPMEAHGCSGHPSVEEHAVLAEELKPFYAKLLHDVK